MALRAGEEMVRGMTATRWLLAYLAAVVAVTFIHEAWLLAALLAAALAAGSAASSHASWMKV
ncbi:MAG: hypothetical protein K8F56_14425, partial [Rhodocyclaceae bacterium]|nr:hypothetical protein [Rhodocyclaceae bacterium]